MTADVSTERSFAQVFTAALRGDDCQVVGLGDAPGPLPVGDWRRAADAADRARARALRRADPRRRLRPGPDERRT